MDEDHNVRLYSIKNRYCINRRAFDNKKNTTLPKFHIENGCRINRKVLVCKEYINIPPLAWKCSRAEFRNYKSENGVGRSGTETPKVVKEFYKVPNYFLLDTETILQCLGIGIFEV